MTFLVKLLDLPIVINQAGERLPQPSRAVVYGETRCRVDVSL